MHCATNRRKDAPATRHLLDAAKAQGVAHLVFISIVGVDDIPYRYYRDKVECERLIADVRHPVHDPARDAVPRLRGDVPEAAAAAPVAHRARRSRRSRSPSRRSPSASPSSPSLRPAGRVADIGGPERLHLRVIAEQWQAAHGTKKKIRMLRLGGKTIRAFQAGHHMTALPGYGTETFAEFAAREAAT